MKQHKQQRKKEKNILNNKDKRTGKVHIVVAKRWPGGERFRRRCPNITIARNLLARINGAIAKGDWRTLKDELTKPEHSKPEQPEARAITFGQLADKFKAYTMSRKQDSDWPLIQCWLLDGMTEYFESDTPITDINIKRREDFIAHRLEEDEVKNCTINKDLSVLRGMINKGVEWSKDADWEYLPVNPIVVKNLADDTMVHDRYLTQKELDALLKAAEATRESEETTLTFFRDMPEFIVIAVSTGLRLSELLTLRISNINFDERVLSVKNKPNKRTKTGLERHIRFNQDTYDVLTELRGRAVNKAGTLFQRIDGSGWFSSKRYIHEQFPAIVKAAGLYSEERAQNVTIHTMRHTFGSRLAISGVPLRRIQCLMGHTSIKTTERYAHLVKEETYNDTEHLQGMTSAYRPRSGQQEETVNAAF